MKESTHLGMSLRQRLLLLTMLTSGLGLLLGFGIYLLFDLHQAKTRTVQELSSTADLIGTNAIAALTFEDEVNGAKLLDALQARPHILGAALFQSDGTFFSSYMRPGLNRGYVFPPPRANLAEWSLEKLVVVRTIDSNGRVVGYIRIESDLESFHQQTAFSLRASAGIAVIMLFGVFLLTEVLGRSITGPIHTLAGTARSVAQQKTYTQRAPLLRGAEMRQLGQDFNHMLDEIAKRDVELVEARDTLEQRVAERTQDLNVEIGERERAEVALRQSEELFRTISAASPVGIFLMDANRKCRFVNERWVEMTGLSTEEASGEGWRKAIHPDDRAAVSERWETQAGRGELYRSSHRYLSVSGNVVEVESLARPLFDATGAVQGYVGVVQDVTSRKASEEKLRRSEEMFRSLCELAPTGIVLLDAAGNVTYANGAWQEMTGLTQEQCLKNGWRTVIHQDDLARVARTRTAAIESGQDYALSYRLLNKKRGVVWVDTIAHSIKVKQGEHTGYVAVIQDVTAHQLAAETLRRAKDAAEAANKAKGDFLANMSHEIRTPMNGIIGMTELALDTQLSSEQRSYLSMVKSSADALLGIINDILDFSKIEAGKMALESAAFSLPTCIEEALRPLAVRANQKNLELSWTLHEGIPEYLKGDATRLRQVLINLAGNAVKFTKEGSVSVRVRHLPAEQDKARLEFSVEDTGIGIPPEKHKEIFDAFSQADTSTTRQFGGTGLGLSISAQLVRLMGGEIWLESECGIGTKFFFTVLLTTVMADEIPALPQRPDLKGCRALIVDDNEVNLHLLEHLLPMWGIEVALANSGDAALQRFSESQGGSAPFSVVLMDKNMPRMDGLETTELLRALPGGDCVPVLLLTSSPVAEDIQDQQRLRIFKRISKPILRAELREALQMALETSAPTAKSHTGAAFSPASEPLRILLAEDNAVNQKLAVRLLEKMGHRVSLTANGSEALQRLSEADFDLILMDIQMPEMGGMEATEVIRRREQGTGRRIPIVAMTAHAMKGDREKCLAGGMDGYVSKPIRPVLLKEEIARVCSSHRPALAESEASVTEISTKHSIDRSELFARVENDEELAHEVLAIFHDEVVRYRQQLQGAVEKKSSSETQKAAHAFKGMLANLAATRASSLAADLEQLAKCDECEKLDPAWRAFDAELSLVVNEAEHLLAGAAK